MRNRSSTRSAYPSLLKEWVAHPDCSLHWSIRILWLLSNSNWSSHVGMSWEDSGTHRISGTQGGGKVTLEAEGKMRCPCRKDQIRGHQSIGENSVTFQPFSLFKGFSSHPKQIECHPSPGGDQDTRAVALCSLCGLHPVVIPSKAGCRWKGENNECSPHSSGWIYSSELISQLC